MQAFRLMGEPNHGNDGCSGFSPDFPASQENLTGSFEGSLFAICLWLHYNTYRKKVNDFRSKLLEKNKISKKFVKNAEG